MDGFPKSGHILLSGNEVETNNKTEELKKEKSQELWEFTLIREKER